MVPWRLVPGLNGTFLSSHGLSQHRSTGPKIILNIAEAGTDEPGAVCVFVDGDIWPGGASGVLSFEDGSHVKLTYAWAGQGTYSVVAIAPDCDFLDDWILQQRTNAGWVSQVDRLRSPK